MEGSREALPCLRWLRGRGFAGSNQTASRAVHYAVHLPSGLATARITCRTGRPLRSWKRTRKSRNDADVADSADRQDNKEFVLATFAVSAASAPFRGFRVQQSIAYESARAAFQL